MKKDIGFKSYSIVIYRAVLFAVFCLIGIFFSAFGKSQYPMILGYLMLAVAILPGIGAILYALRPRVLVQMDDKNVYIWSRRGWISVPLAEIARVYGREQYRAHHRAGKFCVWTHSGKRIGINNIEEPVATKTRVELALAQAQLGGAAATERDF